MDDKFTNIPNDVNKKPKENGGKARSLIKMESSLIRLEKAQACFRQN